MIFTNLNLALNLKKSLLKMTTIIIQKMLIFNKIIKTMPKITLIYNITIILCLIPNKKKEIVIILLQETIIKIIYKILLNFYINNRIIVLTINNK